MTRIGLISDTHGFIHPKAREVFAQVDEIWHAGDVGGMKAMHELKAIKPVRAVYGNIDGQDVRINYPEVQSFLCENVKVLMIHIGGYPKRYEKKARELILAEKPKLFITGHSHILKVMYDEKYDLMHMNPGAAGKNGFHQKITFLRFAIDGNEIKDLEVVEFDRNKAIDLF